jgi:hypothetical protein
VTGSERGFTLRFLAGHQLRRAASKKKKASSLRPVFKARTLSLPPCSVRLSFKYKAWNVLIPYSFFARPCFGIGL